MLKTNKIKKEKVKPKNHFNLKNFTQINRFLIKSPPSHAGRNRVKGGANAL